jgi:hypothetical protein
MPVELASGRRLRVEPLPPYGQSAMGSPGVARQWPNDETYLGWIELAVRNESVMSDSLAGAIADELAKQSVPSTPTRSARSTRSSPRDGRPRSACAAIRRCRLSSPQVPTISAARPF